MSPDKRYCSDFTPRRCGLCGEASDKPGKRWDTPDRNVALPAGELHNAGMGVGMVFLDFVQRIAVGAAAVIALLVVIGISLPRRSGIGATRRTTN
jgi:hypothetical protein